MKQFRILTLLALLMTAATGAWAQSTSTEVSTFADLQTALSAGNDVKLTANIQFTSAIEISGSKKITIDGNGKTMSGPSTCAFIISSGNTLAIKNATIDNFDRNAGGGAIRNNGTLVLDGCTVSNNHTDGNGQGGGAIENQGTLYASNTTFSGNYSSEIGGAINNYGGNLYLSGCTFTNNYTTASNANWGGAIGNNSSKTLVLVNCTFSGNKYGGSNGTAGDLGVFSTPGTYTIAGCTGITIDGATLTTYQYGTATPDYSDLSNIKFDYQKSDTPIAAPAVPKHLITATYREQTRSLEQPLPYATTIGELFEAVTGEHFSDLISTMSSFEMPLTGISSNNTSVVSIGELNGASTPVTVIADGEATISINFGSYAHGILVSAISPLYANMKSGVKDADKWTASTDGTNFGALPIGGLKGDGSETVTLQYNGRLKVKGVKATSDEKPAAQADPLAVPMTIEAITAGSIKVSNPKAGMQYSLDGGKTKNAVTTDDIVLNVGDKVQFYGNGTSITSYNDTFITSSGDGFTCKVYGNIMSLVDEENFATATTLSENYTFSSLFSEFITLTDASGLLLPATQLTVGCYNSMFYGCTALTAAPALTATQLASGCYQQMFRGCARLTTAPELPATQLAASCYLQMFQGCASLTTAPGLPATQLATACYQQMFMGCTALTASPMLPAETLVTSCYRQMFYQCSKLATVTCLATSGINQSTTNYWLVGAGSQAEDTRTVYTVSTANWPTGNNGIPNNWTRVDVDN